MTRTLPLAALVFLVTALAPAKPAHALANRCSYNGQIYEEGVVICQAGLMQMCMNGEWQSRNTFCSQQADGAMLGGPSGGSAPVIIEVPVVEPVEQQ